MITKDDPCLMLSWSVGVASCRLSSANAEMDKQWELTRKAVIAADYHGKDSAIFSRYFRRAQIAWTTFRRTECASENLAYIKSKDWPIAAIDCQIRLTRERTDQLKAMQILYEAK